MKEINWEKVHRGISEAKMPRIKTLSEEQYEVLYKIARKSKMDCWFLIKQHIRGKHAGEDYVYDLENGKQMSLRAGVNELAEGVTDQMIDYFFTDNDIRVLEDVLIGVNV